MREGDGGDVDLRAKSLRVPDGVHDPGRLPGAAQPGLDASRRALDSLDLWVTCVCVCVFLTAPWHLYDKLPQRGGAQQLLSICPCRISNGSYVEKLEEPIWFLTALQSVTVRAAWCEGLVFQHLLFCEENPLSGYSFTLEEEQESSKEKVKATSFEFTVAVERIKESDNAHKGESSLNSGVLWHMVRI